MYVFKVLLGCALFVWGLSKLVDWGTWYTDANRWPSSYKWLMFVTLVGIFLIPA